MHPMCLEPNHRNQRDCDDQVTYSSRHTAEGVVRRALKDGFLSTPMFGLNANTPLKKAQDPCSALLGAKVRLSFYQPR